MKQILLLPALFLLIFNVLHAQTDICGIQILPDQAVASFNHNEDVTVKMDYSTDEAAGVRIFARPFTNGSLTPGYAASGSPLHTGSGTATSSFTITSGDVTVDEVRIEVFKSDNSTLLRRMWVPVRFHFGQVGVHDFTYSHAPELTSLLLGESFSTNFRYSISHPGGVRIFIRPMTNGNLTPGYSASGSGIYTGNGVNGSANFTINSGKNVHVDALRVNIYNADQSQLLDVFFLPVNLYFSTVKLSNIVPQAGNFPFNNDQRTVNYAYSTTESSGVRIFARPWTNGALTPSYTASGSGIYTGSGTSSGSFTITSTNQRVDHIRFRVTNDDQSETLLEILQPVEYCFGNYLISNMVHCPASPVRLEHGALVKTHFEYFNDENQDTRIFVRPFTNGALTPGYSASGSGLYASGSGSSICNFTINSGDVVVDQLRFRVTNADQSVELAEYFVPVQYVFGNPITTAAEEPLGSEVSMLIAPNPAADFTQITLTMSEANAVALFLYDMAGKQVAYLPQRKVAAQVPEVFELRTQDLPSGTYFVVANGENFRSTQTLILQQ